MIMYVVNDERAERRKTTRKTTRKGRATGKKTTKGEAKGNEVEVQRVLEYGKKSEKKSVLPQGLSEQTIEGCLTLWKGWIMMISVSYVYGTCLIEAQRKKKEKKDKEL